MADAKDSGSDELTLKKSKEKAEAAGTKDSDRVQRRVRVVIQWTIGIVMVVVAIFWYGSERHNHPHARVSTISVSQENELSAPSGPGVMSCVFKRDTDPHTLGPACMPMRNISWASTGHERGLLPCIHPLPPAANYVLWQWDGVNPPTQWSPETALPYVAAYGLQATSAKAPAVHLKLVEKPDQCPS